MNKIDWKQKLSSRKLWAALVGVVVGLAAALGIEENDFAQIAGVVTSAASVLAYIFGETKVDAARLENDFITVMEPDEDKRE